MIPSSNQHRRSKMEMHLDILCAIYDGEEKPTRIMSKSNVTWSQLQLGLDFLKENSFIDEITLGDQPPRRADRRSKNRYIVTSKGKGVLRYFRKELTQLGELISSI